MATSCPDCGASMELEQHDVRLRTGTCPTCAKEFAFVEGTAVASRLGASTPATTAAGEEGEETAEEEIEAGPECEECGSRLSFREGKGGSLEASCPDCETTTVYVPQREAAAPERGREPSGRFDSEAPRGRPCRKCGAPLRFSTGDDGGVVGECDSCGNRFSLPPRQDREGGSRGYRGGPQYGRRGFRPAPRGRPYYSDRGARPFRASDRRGPPRDDDESRRRKRRRRDE